MYRNYIHMIYTFSWDVAFVNCKFVLFDGILYTAALLIDDGVDAGIS